MLIFQNGTRMKPILSLLLPLLFVGCDRTPPQPMQLPPGATLKDEGNGTFTVTPGNPNTQSTMHCGHLPIDQCKKAYDRVNGGLDGGTGWRELDDTLIPSALAAGGVRPPIINPFWKQTTWVFDYGNSSGTAADTNNCETTSTACVHRYEMFARFGCTNPQIAQNTTFTMMSPVTGNDDWVHFFPKVNSGVDLIWQGNTRGVLFQSGTIGTVTAQNFSNQDFRITFTATDGGALNPPVGSLIVNTTRTSQAWTLYNPSGSTWGVSEPLLSASPPLHNACGYLAEDQSGGVGDPTTPSWASGNSVSVYTTGGIADTIAEFDPTFEGTNYDGGTPNSGFGGTNQVVIWRIGLTDPTNTATPAKIGSHVQLLEDYIPYTNGAVLDMQTTASRPTGGIINSYMGAPTGRVNVIGSPYANQITTNVAFCLFAGAVNGASGHTVQYTFQGDQSYGLTVGGQFEVTGTSTDAYFMGSKNIDAIQEFNGADLFFSGNTYFSYANLSIAPYNDGPFIWGSRQPIVIGQSKLMFPPITNSPTGNAATGVFVSGSGGIDVNKGVSNTGTGCSICPGTFGTQTVTCGISLTGPNIDNTCGDAGFGGLAWIPNIGTIANFGTFVTQ